MAREDLPEVVRVRYDKLQSMRERGEDPFRKTKYDRDTYSDEIQESFEDYEGKEVSLAGRIMAKRGQGKVAFFDLQDEHGKIQLFLKKDLLDNYDQVKTYDIGDIVGLKGEVFRTKRGETSIRVKDIELLSKSLQVLPEKFHGLKDTDLRYRKRYVDLIVNPEVAEVFRTRSKIIRLIRDFLDDRGFLEVETPVLETQAGGAAARPFITHHNTLDIPLYLRIALELPLKRLIVGGFDKVYELSRVFRNEGMDHLHNPEFTLLETYEAYTDYQGVMRMVEELYEYLAENVLGTTEIEYLGKKISLKAPFKTAKMADLVNEVTGTNFEEIETPAEAREKAEKLGVDVIGMNSVGDVLAEVFDQLVQPTLIQPTFVTHHPIEVSPLAKQAEDERYTERFELFINGEEFANAFSELNDPIEQRRRFEEQLRRKELGDEEAHPLDENYIDALEVGLPPTGGLGVGIDRLVMLFTNQESIRDVILFPTMKM